MANRKVTQVHIDLIEKLLPEMIAGEKNVKEVCQIVNQLAIEKELPEISTDSIRTQARILLKDRPEELEKFNYALVHNSGKRNPVTKRIIEEDIVKKIIEEDLQLILDGKANITDIANKRKLSLRKIRDIIEEHLKKDTDKFEKYKLIVKKNIGASTKTRISSKEKKSRIESSEIVGNKEFEVLSKEEKRKQLIYKFLKMKMNEKENAQINNEESVDKRIQNLIDYFKNRNYMVNKKDDISEDDALTMMYKVPTLLNYSIEEKIKPVLHILEENEQIGYVNANAIVKQFPSIFGYDIKRTEKQLEILEDNNLIDAIIDLPRRLMESPQLMYAQIEYAKERHHTEDLSNVKRSNIFTANSTLMRLYGTNFDEIKQKFILKEKTSMNFSEQIIGKETIDTPTELKDRLQNEIYAKLEEANLNKRERG